MEMHISPEIEARLERSAAQSGRKPSELVQDAIEQYLDGETRFAEAVARGEEALERGDYLTHEEVGRRIQRFL